LATADAPKHNDKQTVDQSERIASPPWEWRIIKRLNQRFGCRAGGLWLKVSQPAAGGPNACERDDCPDSRIGSRGGELQKLPESKL
jgi:hypothetical protein